MDVTDIAIRELTEAPWNANRMDEEMISHLRKSLMGFGVVANLVVRRVRAHEYEVLSGN